MTNSELTKEERDLVFWRAEVINANQHNTRIFESKFISVAQAEKNFLDIAGPADREKFLAAKKIANRK